MKSIYKLFPSKYLRAEDLDDKSFNLVIKNVVIEEMFAHGGGKEEKAVVYFEKAEKGLVLNKTNAFVIAEICDSPDPGEWAGNRIQLFPTTVNAFGSTVDAIRVRECPAMGDEQVNDTKEAAKETAFEEQTFADPGGFDDDTPF